MFLTFSFANRWLSPPRRYQTPCGDSHASSTAMYEPSASFSLTCSVCDCAVTEHATKKRQTTIILVGVVASIEVVDKIKRFSRYTRSQFQWIGLRWPVRGRLLLLYE